MVEVAVKVTEFPAQIGLAEAATEMLVGKLGFTVMPTALDVAGLPVAQMAFEVNTQVTMFPFAKELLEYVALFVPTFAPFIFH